jgi:uncharacterized protein (DUF305 family)
MSIQMRTGSLLAAIMATVVVAGCGSGASTATSPSSSATSSSTATQPMSRSTMQPATTAAPSSAMAPMSSMSGKSGPGALDKAFIAGMVPHHQAASDMAKVELAKGKNQKVRALAQAIVTGQGKEIAEMTSIAKASYRFAPARTMPSMTMSMMGMPMTMDMAAMTAQLQSAGNTDHTFLMLMIPHHASAITMADQERKTGANGQLKSLARSIIAEQGKEIGEMQAMLDAGV